MNQHEIGKKVTELRTNRELTQEELALKCGIKLRLIKKIEAGNLSPRVLILRKIGDELDYKFQFENNDDTKFWLLTLHLSNFLVLPIFPLILWLLKKDEIQEIDTHGKDIINFQISMIIFLFASILLVFYTVGIFLLLALLLYITIITIINSINVVMERNYKYYLTIKFIK